MSQLDIATLSLILVIGLVTATGSTWLVRRAALRLGYVNVPRADRWSRRRVALMGGIGVALGYLLTVGIVAVGIAPDAAWQWLTRFDVLAIHAGALLMAGVGLVDDLLTIK